MEDKASGLTRVCLDASVIIKLLTHEQDSEKAANLFAWLVKKNSKIFEPTFLKIEVYSTLRKKSYFKELSIKKIRFLLKYFEKLPLEYHGEDRKLLDDSLKIAERLSMPIIYDCLYLALAKQKGATFITADKKFVRKAKEIYEKSFSLSEIAQKIR